MSADLLGLLATLMPHGFMQQAAIALLLAQRKSPPKRA